MLKKVKQKFLILTYLLLSSIFVNAQNQLTDSLENILDLENHPTDVQSLSTIDRLFEEYHYQGNEERAEFYANLLIQEANKLDSEFHLRQGRLNKAWTLFTKDKNKSKSMVDELLEEAKITEDKLIEGQCYNFLSNYNRTYKSAYSNCCLLYTSPSPRDQRGSRMPSSA